MAIIAMLSIQNMSDPKYFQPLTRLSRTISMKKNTVAPKVTIPVVKSVSFSRCITQMSGPNRAHSVASAERIWKGPDSEILFRMLASSSMILILHSSRSVLLANEPPPQ